MQESLTDNATWYAFCTRAARRKSTTDGGDQSTKVFTIAHELAHVWIGQNALASADELETGHGRIESFCNGVAAEVLVLKQEFLNAWLHDSGSAHSRVNHVARQFWVSGLVSLRRVPVNWVNNQTTTKVYGRNE